MCVMNYCVEPSLSTFKHGHQVVELINIFGERTGHDVNKICGEATPNIWYPD